MIGRKRNRHACRTASRGARPARSRLMAKSTRMMPFFLTMPINRMRPMMPMTDRSKPPSPQANQRAHAGRRQRRQDGQRMDVAFVEHAENDVDDDKRGRDQHRLVRQCGLEGLRIALEAGDQRGRHADFIGRLLNGIDRLAERHARRQIESHRHGRKLPRMGDQQRADMVGVDGDQSGERDQLPVGRRLDVELVERLHVLLQLRVDTSISR